MTVDHLLVRGLPLNVSFLRLRHVKSTHSEGTHTFAIPDPHIPKTPIPRYNRIQTYRRNLNLFHTFPKSPVTVGQLPVMTGRSETDQSVSVRGQHHLTTTTTTGEIQPLNLHLIIQLVEAHFVPSSFWRFIPTCGDTFVPQKFYKGSMPK